MTVSTSRKPGGIENGAGELIENFGSECSDTEAIRYLLFESGLAWTTAERVDEAVPAGYDRLSLNLTDCHPPLKMSECGHQSAVWQFDNCKLQRSGGPETGTPRAS
jgi:hypothetical protein